MAPPFKTDCKVDGHSGFAHVVEQEYNPRFKVWYGCVQILCDKDTIEGIYAFGCQFVNRSHQLELKDGRSMTIFVQSCDSQLNAHEGSSYLGCYFVSLTPLLNLADFLSDPGSFRSL
jgi:hypothetical protein